MKDLIIRIILLVLAGSGLLFIGYVKGANTNSDINKDYNQLYLEVEELRKEKFELKSSIEESIVNNGTAKYLVTFQIKQSHFTLDIGEHLKDKINEIEFDVFVDKDYYDSVSVGSVINDDFRIGSFIAHGSFGNWRVTVSDKQIVEGEK